MPVAGIDYHREKYALVALAEHLISQGWTEVLLSVDPRSLTDQALKGVMVPTIDAALDRDDPRYRYTFYTDRGGRHDLVAKRGSEMLVVEAKGRSGKPISSLEQLVGRSILAMAALPPGARMAILIPDHPAWVSIVTAATHPALADVEVFTVTPVGAIGKENWGR